MRGIRIEYHDGFRLTIGNWQAIFGFAILKPLSKAVPETGILGFLLGGPFGPKENCTVQSAATGESFHQGIGWLSSENTRLILSLLRAQPLVESASCLLALSRRCIDLICFLPSPKKTRASWLRWRPPPGFSECFSSFRWGSTTSYTRSWLSPHRLLLHTPFVPCTIVERVLLPPGKSLWPCYTVSSPLSFSRWWQDMLLEL